MKKLYISIIFSLISVSSQTTVAQNTGTSFMDNGSEYTFGQYDADHPEITPQQYELIDKRCAENIKLLGLDKIEKSTESDLFDWPLRAASGFTDCSYYVISAFVDENTASGSYNDYNCGTNSYDGHQGTDIASWPFSFYKMDHSTVEIVAAAPGTIIDKHDGEFDRNCASNNLTANYVIIQHADGSVALYWHMKSGAVTTKAVGQTVAVGEYLGVVGSSGSSTGPHLHFEVWSGTTSSTYKDPFYGTCNLLNPSSLWISQKPHDESSILKASVHTTDVLIPGCPTTETPNESTSYSIPFQGPGLSPGYAKFYIFIRDMLVGTTVSCSILNPDGTTFNSWTLNCNNNYTASYWAWSKLLPTNTGTYSFQATYGGMTCSQAFDIINTTGGIPALVGPGMTQIYPDPSDGDFTLQLGDGIAGKCTIEIFNILGDRAYQSDISEKRTQIKSNLKSGIYYYQVKNNTGNLFSGKLMVK